MASLSITLTRTTTVAAIATALVACGNTSEQPEMPVMDASVYTEIVVAEGLSFPWDLTFLPGGDVLVTERDGALRLIGDGGLEEEAIAGVPDSFFAGQGGLLEVEATPDFAQTNEIILTYSGGDEAANHTAVFKARLDDMALVDGETIFRSSPDRDTDAHYGGRVAFLPDGTMLLTLGDAFAYREQAQLRDNHLGTVVRMTLDGTPPADNPFFNEGGDAAFVYSYGHRNVQGIAFDSRRGIIWEHEHGPAGGDELNQLSPGDNYGWPIVTEGRDYNGARISPFEDHEEQGFTAPVWGWTPSIAPAGLAVYDDDLFADWTGDLFVAALAGTAIHHLDLDANGAVNAENRIFLEGRPRIRQIATGPDGALWVLTDGAEGKLVRLVPAE